MIEFDCAESIFEGNSCTSSQLLH